MIGLDIRVRNEYSNYLYKILDGIDFLSYVWEVNYEDFLYHENGDIKQVFFPTSVLNGVEFFKCISRDSYYMIFADIKAYPLGSERSEIKTYNDFVESNCEVILLCTDSMFIEFYSKKRNVLDRVYNNCIGENFEKVAYLTTEDASGRSFVAW